MPAPVSTNSCFASLPNTGPNRPSLRSHTFFQLSPRSVVAIRASSVSQYSVSPCQCGRALTLYAPHGCQLLPPSVVRMRFGFGFAVLFASATTAVWPSNTHAGPYPLPTSAKLLPPSCDASSRPPDSCFSTSRKRCSASVQSTAHQSTWADLPSTAFQTTRSASPKVTGAP